MNNKQNKLATAESRWVFKQIAYSLLQGNAVGYAENPNIWIKDARNLTDKLIVAVEFFSNFGGSNEQDS